MQIRNIRLIVKNENMTTENSLVTYLKKFGHLKRGKVIKEIKTHVYQLQRPTFEFVITMRIRSDENSPWKDVWVDETIMSS